MRLKLDIKILQAVIVDALDDIRARDIVVFDTSKGTAEFDRVIIATAEVARQTKAMAMNVIEKVKQAGGRIVSMEGGETGEWVLVDCSDAIVHIMQPAVRQYYNLEELWGQKKVVVMTAAEKAAEVKAAAVKKAAIAKAAAAKAAKMKLAAKARPAAGNTAKKGAAKPVKTPAKNAAKKAMKKTVKKVLQRTRKKIVPVKKPAASKAIYKTAAPKKPIAAKPAAKKFPAKTIMRKPPPAKKSAAKKTAAKK